MSEAPVFNNDYIKATFMASAKKLHKVFTMFDYTWWGDTAPSVIDIYRHIMELYVNIEEHRINAIEHNDANMLVEWISSGRIRLSVDINSKFEYDDMTISIELGGLWEYWNEDLGHGDDE
jgi:hypothetical protein